MLETFSRPILPGKKPENLETQFNREALKRQLQSNNTNSDIPDDLFFNSALDPKKNDAPLLEKYGYTPEGRKLGNVEQALELGVGETIASEFMGLGAYQDLIVNRTNDLLTEITAIAQSEDQKTNWWDKAKQMVGNATGAIVRNINAAKRDAANGLFLTGTQEAFGRNDVGDKLVASNVYDNQIEFIKSQLAKPLQNFSNFSPENKQKIDNLLLGYKSDWLDFSGRIARSEDSKAVKTNYANTFEKRKGIKGDLVKNTLLMPIFGAGMAGLGVAGAGLVGARSLINAFWTEKKLQGVQTEQFKKKEIGTFGDTIVAEFGQTYNQPLAENIDLETASVGEVVRYMETYNLQLDPTISAKMMQIFPAFAARIDNFEITGIQAASIKKLNSTIFNLELRNDTIQNPNSALANEKILSFLNKIEAQFAESAQKLETEEFKQQARAEASKNWQSRIGLGLAAGVLGGTVAFGLGYVARKYSPDAINWAMETFSGKNGQVKIGDVVGVSSHAPAPAGQVLLRQVGDLKFYGPQGSAIPTDEQVANAITKQALNLPVDANNPVKSFQNLKGVYTIKPDSVEGNDLKFTQNSLFAERNRIITKGDSGEYYTGVDLNKDGIIEPDENFSIIGRYKTTSELVIADKNTPPEVIAEVNKLIKAKEIEPYFGPRSISYFNPSENLNQPTVAITADGLTRLQNALGNNASTNTPLPGSDLAIRNSLTGGDGVINQADIANAKLKIGVDIQTFSNQLADPKNLTDPNFNRLGVIAKVTQLNSLKQEIENLKPGQTIKLNDDLNFNLINKDGTIQLDPKIATEIKQITDPKKFGLGDKVINQAERSDATKLGKIQDKIDSSITELKKLKSNNLNNPGLAKIVDQRISELQNIKKAIPTNDQVTITQSADGKLSFKGDNAINKTQVPPIPQDGSIPETPKPVDQRLVPKPTFQDPLGSTNLANSFGQNMSNEITKKLGPDIDNNELPLLNDILKKYAKKISKDDFTPEDVDRIIKNLSAHFKNNPSAKIRIDTIESDRIVFTSTSDSNLQISFPEDPRVIADPGSLAQPFEQRINENDEIIKTLTGGIRKDEVGKLEAQLNNLFKDKPQMKPLIQDMRRELDKYFANTANTNKTVRYGGILLGKDAKLNRIVLEGASGEELTAFDDTITTQPTVPKVQTIQPQSVTRTNTTSQFPNANQTNNGIIRTQPTSPQQPTITRVPDTARPGVETQQPNITQPVQPLAPTQKGEFLGSNTTELSSYLTESRGGIGKIDILFGKGNKPDPAVSNLLSRMNTSGSNISIKDLKGIAQVTGLYKNSNGDLLTGADIRKDLDNILQQQGLTVQNLTSTDIDKLLFETYKVERIGGMGVGVYGGETPSLQDVQRYQQILEKVNQEFVAEGKLIYNPGDYSEQMFNPAYPNAEQEYGDILALKRNEFVLSLKGRNTTNYNANFRIGNEARGASAWARDVYDKSNQTIQPQGLSNPATPPTGLTNQVTQTNLTDNGVLSLTPANVEAFNNATTPGQTMVLTNNIPKPPQGTSFITYPVANNSFGADVNPADGRTNEIVGGYEIREYSNGYTLLFQTDPNADLLPGEYSAIPTMGPNPTPDQTLPAKIRFHVGDPDNPIYQTQANPNKQAIPAQPINAGQGSPTSPSNQAQVNSSGGKNTTATTFSIAEIGNPERGDVTATRTAFNSGGTIDGLDINKDIPGTGSVGLPFDRHIPAPDLNIINRSIKEMNANDYYNNWHENPKD